MGAASANLFCLMNASASDLPDPVLDPYMELLPTDQIAWPELESLLRKILRDVEGLRDVRPYGVPGQAQYGLDVTGTALDGTKHAVQSKRYQAFTVSDLTAAVDKFIAKRDQLPFRVSRLVVATGCPAERTEITDELDRLRLAHPDVTIELWDQRELADFLRGRRDIVAPAFGDAVADRFCLPGTPYVVDAPPVDRINVADATLRGPATTTGADHLLKRAGDLEGFDPGAAAQALQDAAELLTDGGFAAHASVLNTRRAELLAQAGEPDAAARLLSDAFWQAIMVHDFNEARMAETQLKKIPESETARTLACIAEAALGVARHPLDASAGVALDNLRAAPGDSDIEYARLLVLTAENSAIDPDDAWRPQHIDIMRTHADTISDCGEFAAELACRLRIEVADVTGEWTDLLKLARRGRLARHLCVLILARYAMHEAEHGRPDEAEEAWENATEQACLDGQNDDAAEYVFARRVLDSRYYGRFQTADLHLSRSLRALGNKRPSSSMEQVEEKAMRELIADKPHVAVPLLRAFHRAAHASGSWGSLLRARELLADTYAQTGEPKLAAGLYAMAGTVKKATHAAATNTNVYIDVRPCLAHPAYWVNAVAYNIIAEQADLIPDDQVTDISAAALDVLDAARHGNLQDSPLLSPSVKLSAVKFLASLAERLPHDHARRLLEHMEPWVPRKPNRYRRTDDDHVLACVGIATTNSDLRTDAIDQLMGLLDAADSGVSDRVEREARQLVQEHPDLVRERLVEMAGRGNRYGAQLLRTINPEPTSAEHESAAEAKIRLRKAPTNTAQQISIGTGAQRDALLAQPLPPNERHELAQIQLQHARSPYEPSANKAEYYGAARILAHDLNDVAPIFQEAIERASDRSGSLGDITLGLDTHPLSTFRVSGMNPDTRPDALFLAAVVARSEAQREQVRQLAYTMIGSSAAADRQITNALQVIDGTPDRDIPLLATQPHWPLRALAAIHWARSSMSAADIGHLLADDRDPHVRRTLAEAVSTSPSNPAAPEVRQALSEDRCYSVRRRTT